MKSQCSSQCAVLAVLSSCCLALMSASLFDVCIERHQGLNLFCFCAWKDWGGFHRMLLNGYSTLPVGKNNSCYMSNTNGNKFLSYCRIL